MTNRAPRTSPTVRRRRLAAEMRRLRKESGATRDDAATFAGIAGVTVTRIEAGQHAPKPADIAMLCKFYGVDEVRTELLVNLARQSRQRGWWHKFGAGYPGWFEVYIGLEEEASQIQSYQPELIGGLLQTEGYMQALIEAELEVPNETEVQRRIDVRKKRQERLVAQDSPRMCVVIHEGALRLQVGGKETMREQLAHLDRMSRLNSVTLQVWPFTAGAHPAMQGGFYILSFPEPEDADVAYVEYRTGGLYLEQAAEVATFQALFNQVRASALGQEESRELMSRISRELG